MRRITLGLTMLAVLSGLAAPAWAQPTGWVTVGGHAALETGRLNDILQIEGAVLVGAGFHLLRIGPLLFGADAEVTAGRVTADLGPADDKITVYRGRLGLRATWWIEHEEPRFVPYARGGAVYRTDRGDLIKDDGFGWYAGIGLDVRFSETWSFGPFATFERISLSIETETVLVGIALTFSY